MGSHSAALAKIKKREKKADARVRQRLSERRKERAKAEQLKVLDKETKVNNMKLKQWQVVPVTENKVIQDYTLEVKAFRTKLVGLIKTPKKLFKLCAKLDKDNDALLSKMEFQKIVKAVAKKPYPSDELF